MMDLEEELCVHALLIQSAANTQGQEQQQVTRIHVQISQDCETWQDAGEYDCLTYTEFDKRRVELLHPATAR